MTKRPDLMVDTTEAPTTDARAVAWLHSRWERDTRYYELRVQQDLFGDWLLTRVWGRRGSALGQIRHEVCVDQADAQARYAEATIRREKRGYRLRRPVGAGRVGSGPVITLGMELDEDIKGKPK